MDDDLDAEDAPYDPPRHPFGMSGDAWWQDDVLAPAQAASMDFLLGRRFGLFVDLPEEVEVGARTSIPAPILFCGVKREVFWVELDQHGVLVAVRPADGTVLVRQLMAPLTTPRVPVARDDSSPTVELRRTDLQLQLELLDRPGEWILTAFAFGWATKPAKLAVVQPPQGFEDPEVTSFLAARRGVARPRPPAPPRPRPGDPVPTFERREDSPEVPSEEGLALAVERLLVNEAGARAVLRGSFRLPVPPAWRVPSPAEEEAWADAIEQAGRERPAPVEYGEPRPQAIVPVTVVVQGSEEPYPKVIELRAPTWDEVPREGGEATGHFAVDLLAIPELRETGQTHFIYAFAGAAMTGPRLCAVVTPEMLAAT